MRQLPSDKYNVAWFKLAEFVARGERERALGLYKLLVHSFDDRALAYQLEGDLLLSFNDQAAACQCYLFAAESYKNDMRIIEAAAVYEHLILLNPEIQEYHIHALELYDQLGIFPRLLVHLNRLCSLLIQSNEFEQLGFFLSNWEHKINRHDAVQFYKNLTLELIKYNAQETLITQYLKKALNCCLEDKDSSVLQAFLSTIEVLHSKYYHEATIHLNEL